MAVMTLTQVLWGLIIFSYNVCITSQEVNLAGSFVVVACFTHKDQELLRRKNFLLTAFGG